MNNNTTDTLASLSNSKDEIEAKIKKLTEQIKPFFDPDEINRQDEGTPIVPDPEKKAELEQEVEEY